MPAFRKSVLAGLCAAAGIATAAQPGCLDTDPLPDSPAPGAEAVSFNVADDDARMKIVLWRVSCAPACSRLAIRVAPTLGVPHVCGGILRVIQGGVEYPVYPVAAGLIPFCGEVHQPTTFLLGQYGSEPQMNRDNALVLAYAGSPTTSYGALPAFPPATPPRAMPSESRLENPTPGSFQSGIGLISGWSCQGGITVTVDGASIAVPHGGPRADAASACSGNPNTGFGVLVNYNNFGAGTHTAQLYVNGSPRGDPARFTVTTPAGDFMRGVAKTVVVPDFPVPGKSTSLIWQESQQNFAIQSVEP